MDLIAGLPRDTAAGFRSTLDQVIALKPENYHRPHPGPQEGARLMMEREGLPSGEETAAMLDYAWQALADAGQIPYYLYRQKYMSGALENIGWCSPRHRGALQHLHHGGAPLHPGPGGRGLHQTDGPGHRENCPHHQPQIPTAVPGAH